MSFIFMPAFPLGRVAGATAPEGLGIPRDQQQFQIVLLAPHHDGTKQGRRCRQSNWSFDDISVAFPWVSPAGHASPVFCGAFWIHGGTNVVAFSRFREFKRKKILVVRHSGLSEFHSFAICREVSHQRRNEGGTTPKRRITGAGRRKVLILSQFFSSMQYIYSQKILGSNMEAPNLFLAPGAI